MSRKYDWPALLEAHAKSGLSQTAFCRQNNVCAKYFSLQKSRAAKAKGGAGKPDKSDRFVRAVPQVKPVASPSMLTVSVGSVSLRFGSDTDPAYVAKLVAALS
jgi:hypothetical protein